MNAYICFTTDVTVKTTTAAATKHMLTRAHTEKLARPCELPHKIAHKT